MRKRALSVVAAVTMVALAGCGSSGTSSNTSGGGGSSDAGSTIVRAADVTGSSSAYQFQASMKITGGSTSLTAGVSGTILGSGTRGALTGHESVNGEAINIVERFSGKTYWVSSSGIPDASKLTSKPWLKYNLQSTLNALSLGGLPSASTDPTQFLKYLKTAGADAQKVGTATIRGVPTTHYAVTVNLNNYARLVPLAGRAAARKTIQVLISSLGSDTLHMQVWIDHHDFARRLYVAFPECVGQLHLHLGLTMDLFNFGTKATVTLPTAAQSYDITPLVDKEMATQKVACTAA